MQVIPVWRWARIHPDKKRRDVCATREAGEIAPMGSIGFYVMVTLLCAGAVYGLSHKGEPRPAVTSGQKKLLIFLAGVVLVCLLLLLALAFIGK